VVKRGMVIVTVLALALLALGCGGGGDLPEGGVGQVGEVTITQEQLDAKVAEIQGQLQGQVPTKEESPEEFAQFEKQVLDYLITLEVVTQKAPELDVAVTDGDVDQQLEQIKTMFGGDEAKFEEALQEQNLTLESLKKNLREQELIKKVIEAVTADAEVSDDEVAAKYEENKDQYQVDETRKTRHILFSPGTVSDGGNADDQEWQAAKEEADQVRKEIMSGGDFGELAKEHSDDPGSKPQGGDLGNVGRGMMVPEFDEATFSLEKDAISEPIRTQFGYHLIQVQEINPAGTRSLDEMKEQLRAQLEDEKKREIWEDWLAEQRDALDVEVKDGMELTTTTLAPADEEAGGEEPAETPETPETPADEEESVTTTTSAE
jgi:foldase protein PrsA